MRPNRLEPMVRTEERRQQRVEFQRHEPHAQQQQRLQRESGCGCHEFIETESNAYD